MGVWLELVILIIPTLNDDDKENQSMCEWIVKHLGADVPIHLTRYHPMYKMKNIPSTPVKTLERLHQIAIDAGINYAYIGNVPGHPTEHTVCPKCKKVLIQRIGYRTKIEGIKDGKCKACNTTIAGVWKKPL